MTTHSSYGIVYLQYFCHSVIMSNYVNLSIHQHTYQKIKAMSQRLQKPKLKVVDMAVNRLSRGDEEAKIEFERRWSKIWFTYL